MNPAPYQHKILLLESGFQHADHRLLFTRARLYPDRIELSGWTLNGRHRTLLPLAQISHVTWDHAAAGPNAIFRLQDGSECTVRLPKLHLWQDAVEERLRWASLRPYRSLPFETAQELSLKDLIAYSASMS